MRGAWSVKRTLQLRVGGARKTENKLQRNTTLSWQMHFSEVLQTHYHLLLNRRKTNTDTFKPLFCLTARRFWVRFPVQGLCGVLPVSAWIPASSHRPKTHKLGESVTFVDVRMWVCGMPCDELVHSVPRHCRLGSVPAPLWPSIE